MKSCGCNIRNIQYPSFVWDLQTFSAEGLSVASSRQSFECTASAPYMQDGPYPVNLCWWLIFIQSSIDINCQVDYRFIQCLQGNQLRNIDNWLGIYYSLRKHDLMNTTECSILFPWKIWLTTLAAIKLKKVFALNKEIKHIKIHETKGESTCALVETLQRFSSSSLNDDSNEL